MSCLDDIYYFSVVTVLTENLNFKALFQLMFVYVEAHICSDLAVLMAFSWNV